MDENRPDGFYGGTGFVRCTFGSLDGESGNDFGKNKRHQLSGCNIPEVRIRQF